jgi:hypothetical protein
MKTNILATAVALSDQDLLNRINALAGKEREASVELLAHLAALELRPSLYAAQGYGSLFAYCTQALRLPEDSACNRIRATRVCRRFPEILDLLASGSLTFSTVRMLGPHLTESNHTSVLAQAVNRTREEIEALIAELAPRPDVAASVRKLPCPKQSHEGDVEPADICGAPASGATALPLLKPATPMPGSMGADPPAASLSGASSPSNPTAACLSGAPFGSDESADPGSTGSVPPPSAPWRHRAIVRALAPQRYRVQFTIGQDAHDQLRRLQALLRREIPSGDAGLIFEQALALLVEKVEKAKLGAGARQRSKAVIRPGADKPDKVAAGRLRPRETPSRHIPNEVRRLVWMRDAGQCAYVSAGGQRCRERTFLELHHIRP